MDCDTCNPCIRVDIMAIGVMEAFSDWEFEEGMNCFLLPRLVIFKARDAVR